MKRQLRLLLLVVILCGSTVSSQNKRTAGVIWTGISEGVRITWTQSDITLQSVANPGQSKLSFRNMILKEWKSDLDRQACSEEMSFKILSVVGNLVSMQVTSNGFCGGAHPYSEIAYRTINLHQLARLSLTNPQTSIKLTDYFSPDDILRALMADSIIQQAVRSSGKRVPRNLQGLIAALATANVPYKDCGYYLGEDFLTQFAFHHVEDNKIAVRLSLPHAYETCRGTHIDLGLLLPIPSQLSGAISQAASKQSGILMKDLSAMSGKRSTNFSRKGKSPW